MRAFLEYLHSTEFKKTPKTSKKMLILANYRKKKNTALICTIFVLSTGQKHKTNLR